MGRGRRERERDRDREKVRRSRSSSSSTDRSRRRRSSSRKKSRRDKSLRHRSASESPSRYRSSRRRSESRERRVKKYPERSGSESRDSSDHKSKKKTSHGSRHKSSKRSKTSRKRNSSDSEETARPTVAEKYVFDDTESKIEKAIKAAEAAGLTMCKLPSYERKEVTVKEDMPTIQDRNVLDELNMDTFVPKQFTSSKNKKLPENIVIDLDAGTVKVPDVDLPRVDSLFHPDKRETTETEDNRNLTHEELVEITTSCLYTIMQTDDLLKDIPSDVTLEELAAKTAVEYGQSITVVLSREREKPLEIIVPQGTATVGYLKKAIRRQFEMFQKRAKHKRNVKISWKYVWRTYALEYEGRILDNDGEPISSYGVSNKCKIKFVEKHKIK